MVFLFSAFAQVTANLEITHNYRTASGSDRMLAFKSEDRCFRKLELSMASGRYRSRLYLWLLEGALHPPPSDAYPLFRVIRGSFFWFG